MITEDVSGSEIPDACSTPLPERNTVMPVGMINEESVKSDTSAVIANNLLVCGISDLISGVILSSCFSTVILFGSESAMIGLPLLSWTGLEQLGSSNNCTDTRCVLPTDEPEGYTSLKCASPVRSSIGEQTTSPNPASVEKLAKA